MAQNFVYKAKNRTGQFLAGTILAENESAVASYVRDKGYFVINIKPEKSGGLSSFATYLQNMRKVSVKEMAILCRQFSTMIDAGMPIVSCLNILIEQTANPRLKNALQDVYKRVKEGETLSSALAVYPKIFPNIMINMMEAGEVGGVLDDVLNRLATHLEKEYKMNSKVKSAMTYPMVIITIAILSVMAILVFVMPTFVQLFANMKIELPLPTKILLFISDFLRNNIILVLLGIVGVFGGGSIAIKQKNVRIMMDTYIVRLPILGVLFQKIAVARFTRTLSTLIKSGVSLLIALDVVKKTIGNTMMEERLSRVQINVKEGMSLATTLTNSQIFNSMVVQMVAIGEESGSLDRMLEKVADFYENDVDDMVTNLSSLLEPVIIVFLGVVVAFIAVSIMLPLFDIMTGAGQTL